MLLNSVQAAKWGLSNPRPNMAAVFYLWSDMALLNLDRMKQMHSGVVQKEIIFSASLAIGCISEFHLKSVVRLSLNRRLTKEMTLRM